jgi:uncharacterized protein
MFERILKLPKNNSFFLIGPRQTGKTSLIRSRFSAASMFEINLLLPDYFRRYTVEPQRFLEDVRALPATVSHVFIDEVQKVPALLDLVQELMVQGVPQKFILSGSSARKLKRGHANLLGGRAWNLQMHPITTAEILLSAELEKIPLRNLLQYGTLPSILTLESPEEKNESLRAYADIYLKEEIIQESVTRKLDSFLQFLQCAAQMNAEQVNYSNIAKDTKVSSNLVSNYYSILEDTRIGRFLYSYHESERKRHKLSPKFYFFDNGVLRSVQGQLTVDAQSFAFGNLFETYVINEVFRINDYYRKDFKLSFLRTASDVEVDLIITKPNGTTIGVEIKSKPFPEACDYESGFQALKQIRKDTINICVCTGTQELRKDGVSILGYRDFLTRLCEDRLEASLSST